MMTLVKRFLISATIGLLFWSPSYAQNLDTTTYKIEWKKNTLIIINGVQKEVITFKNAAHLVSGNFLPQFGIEIKGKNLVDAQISEGSWVDLKPEELNFLLNPTFVFDDCKIAIHNSTEKKRPVSSISFVPIRRNQSTGKIEKLLNFKIKYTESFTSSNAVVNSQFRLGSTISSALAQGEWYKLGFDKSGIYKIDYSFLEKMGLKPDDINPSHIQIWGNGGGMLPELCKAVRPIDLTQNAIQVVGGEDGKFDPQDYVLFYVQGPNTWVKNSGEPFFRPTNNIYSKTSFYFLTISGVGTKTISQLTFSNPVSQITTNNRREVHELDLRNFLMSGRKWYGEEFGDGSSQTISYPTTGIVNDTKVYLQSSLMNKSTDNNPSTFVGSINENTVNSWSISGAGTGNYVRIAHDLDVLDSISSNSISGANDLRVSYLFKKTSTGNASGYLNYFAVNFTEQLRYENTPLFFRNISSLDVGFSPLEYKISKNAINDLTVWDITNVTDVNEMIVSNTVNECSFVAQGDTIVKEFIAFSGSSFPNPVSIEKIENQNIRGSNTPDFLIVVHPTFLAQAQKLADFRTLNDKLDVLVVTTDQVYNEFSSGAQDLVAIRDCARMFFLRGENKFSNMLLFGAASYDYKNLNNTALPTSLVPVYESSTSLDPIFSYSSDDYVGLLDDKKGLWTANDAMDIGVGRLPVRNVSDAEALISKIINYSLNADNLGNWRQKLTYIADSGDNDVFLENAEDLSDKVNSLNPQYNLNKIYVASYNKVVLPDAVIAPDVNTDINRSIVDGSFIVNYIGHGSETNWSAKNIMNIPTIQAYENKFLPFMVTATCDFGRYDAPSILSGGETFLLHPNGGAVGLLTTTRPVYQSSNEVINNAFHDFAFDKDLRLGDILRLCKNRSSYTGEINRNFALLGDPSLRLSYPKNEVALTKINGKELVSFADTLKAQSKVTFIGEIRNGNGLKMTDFNGVVDIVIFDKGILVKTVDIPSTSFSVVNKKIFDGSATVKDGGFEFTFIVSKDINYRIDLGKISLYANAENGSLVDAGGAFNKIYIGSGLKNVPIDNTPPIVKSFINDETFVQGGITNQNPLLIVKLYDESGISTVGGIGNSITVTLAHENSQQQIILDSYFKSDRDSYQSGTIKYRLSNLKEGNYTAKVDASDANKNTIGKEGNVLEFNVINGSKLTLNKILNYPNPFTSNTTFHFDHNRAGDDLEVSLQIFTVTGKLVKTLSTYESSSNSHIGDLHWDGKDEYGDNIGRGVYVYKLSVRALSDGAKKEEYQKLVILN